MAKPAAHGAPSANCSDVRHLRRTAAALAVAACFSISVALANPSNPTVVHGTATFASAGNILNITNSQNAVINWGSFSIGINELTRFIQPSALSAVLNRVTGQDPSAILGALQSNGRVFLINPNGITFGAGAQIDVAGLVASTLNLSNDDFLNNRLRFTDGALAGNVVNQGSITGGSVYLVGKAVTNDGLITSPNGEVVLAAGNSVELVNPGTPDLRVEIVAPDNEARNLGTITAEAGRIGIYAGLIHNSGTLNASSAVAEGGRILLKATQNTTLASSSILDASGVGGGRIDVLADDTVRVDGRLDASAPTSGDGGFIETSGKNRATIADSAIITTNAPQGQTGTWLIDPNDFVISASGGDTTGSAISSSLGTTNVLITSDNGSGFYGGGNGDILINDLITWSANNSLTLLAKRHIEVNSQIDGGGDLLFYAGWDGGSTSVPVVTSGVGDITSSFNSIRTRGNIYFEAGRDILLGAVTVWAGNNVANGVATDGIDKSVQLIAGRNIALTDPEGGTQVRVIGNNGSSATVVLQAKTGSISITGSEVQAEGGAGVESAGGDATVTLCTGALAGGICTPSALGGITVSDSAVGAVGGSGSSGQRGGDAVVKLTAGGSGIQVSGAGFSSGSSSFRSFYAIGGSGSSEGRGGDATVMLTSTGGITVNSGASVNAYGGSGGNGSYYSGNGGGRGGDATVTLTSTGGGLTVNSGASVGAYGGYGGYGYSAGSGGRGGDAKVELTSGGTMTINGTVQAVGGWGNSGSSGGGRGGNGTVELTSSSGMTLSGASISADSGEGAYGSTTSGSATITLKAAGPITVSSSGIYASAGSASSGGVRGGSASVTVESTGSSVSIDNSSIYATGEDAYWSFNAGDGGTASITINSAGATTLSAGTWVEARGGDGAEGGVAGTGTVTVTAGGGIMVSNSVFNASGGNGVGSFGIRQGGAATILLNATGGNIQMEGAEGLAYGGYGTVGGNARAELKADAGSISVSGKVIDSLSAFTSGVTPGTAEVILTATGDITLSNTASLLSEGILNISGANVLLDNAQAIGEGSLVVKATGNLDVLSASELSGGALGLGSATLTVGGNVTVANNSFIRGNPDVVMSVIGTVNMNDGGTIEAVAPTTIYLTFPMLTGGGYFVNGVEEVVYDPLTLTGFLAGSLPAILDTNLFITYGGTAVAPPTDALLVAMGESLEPPEAEKNKDIFAETEDEKKKDAPVCR